MPESTHSPARVFKTTWFSKAAKKAAIPDSALHRSAKGYAGLSAQQVQQLIDDQHFVEICHGP